MLGEMPLALVTYIYQRVAGWEKVDNGAHFGQ